MYPTLAMVGLMLLTWGVAVWAMNRDEEPEGPNERMAGLYDKAA